VFAYHSWALKAVRYKFFGERLAKKLAPIATDTVLKQLREDLKLMPKGHVFLVHLLMPHFSYLYDSQCKFRAFDSKGRVNRELKYQLYFDQMKCLHDMKLASLFQYLRELGLYDASSIIVLGDHGSRITDNRHVSDAKTEDYLDLFSAFLAIKPGGYHPDFQLMEGGNCDRKTPIVQGIWQYFRMPLTPISESFCKVNFQDANRFVTVKMPDFPTN
jgi:hypothetical protein